MPHAFRDVFQDVFRASHEFASAGDFRRNVSAGDIESAESLLFAPISEPSPAEPDSHALATAVVPDDLDQPDSFPTVHAMLPVELSERRQAEPIGIELPPRSPRASPVVSSEPPPETSAGLEPGQVMTGVPAPQPRSPAIERAGTIDVHLDPSRLAEELESRLQPRLEELALSLTRRVDDQLARALFTQHAHGP